MPKQFYSVKEASKILGVSTNTIYKYLDVGSLKGKRFNNRGRFKIPYSEIAPYLGQEVSADTTEKPQEKIQAVKSDGAKFPLFESLGILLTGIVVLYILWSFGKGAAVFQPSLITDIGNAVWGYSGRTFSGFGSLVSRVTGTQSLSQKDVVSNPLTEIASEEKVPDLSYKLDETESRTNDLYANVQVLSSNSQRLLGKSKTLTSVELNDTINKMSDLLGSLTDTSDKGTIFAEINWLGENWDFSSIEASKRAASQVAYLLDSLQSQSLAAFSKPDPSDLDNLVAEIDSLQGSVGNVSDTSAEKTLYGDIKGVESLAQALDAKSKEIDKILESWNSYSTSEKENIVKSILSDTLSINNLPHVDEIVQAPISGQIADLGLKNILLFAKGILSANKTHLSQKANDTVLVTWIESDGTVKTLDLYANEIPKVAVNLNESNVLGAVVPTAVPSGILGVNAESPDKPLVKTVPVTENTPTPKVIAANVQSTTPYVGVVAGAGTSILTSEMQKIIGAGIGLLAFATLAVYLLTLFVKSSRGRNHASDSIHLRAYSHSILEPDMTGEKSPKVQNVKRPGIKIGPIITDAFLSVKKVILGILSFPIRVTRVIAAGLKKVFLSVTKTIITAVTSLLKIPVSIYKFVIKILLSIKKFLIFLIGGLFKVMVAVVLFPVKVISSVKKFFIFLAASLRRLVVSVIYAIKAFFVNIISAVTKAIVSVKTGILTILSSIAAFFLRILSLIKKLVVSIITGLVNFITTVVTSLQNSLRAIVRAAIKFLVSVISFFSKLFSSTVKLVISVITGTVNIVVSVLTSLVQGFRAVISAVKTFLLSIIFAVGKFLTSVKDLSVAIVVSLVQGTIAVIHAITLFLIKTASRIITFLANVVFAVRKVFTSIFAGLQKILLSGITFVLKAIFLATKSLASVVKSLLKVLTSMTKATDSVLTQLKFETPDIRK